MDQKGSHERFLEEDATSEQRERALSLNIQCWFTLSAQSKSREAVYEEGLMWTSGHLVISSINPLHIEDQLDRALQWFRAQQPLDEVICWYATATPPGDLAARLLARGFEPDEQPNWMWCNLRDLPNQRIPSSTFNIQAFEDELVAQADTLPYYPAEKRNARAIMHRLDPRQIRSLVAFQRGQVVGRCMLNLTTGEWGIGSLFAMAVVPAARHQGIGTALAWEACNLARQMGCHHIVLNATPMGEPVYRRLGFRPVGYGLSWLLRPEALAASLTNDKEFE